MCIGWSRLQPIVIDFDASLTVTAEACRFPPNIKHHKRILRLVLTLLQEHATKLRLLLPAFTITVCEKEEVWCSCTKDLNKLLTMNKSD